MMGRQRRTRPLAGAPRHTQLNNVCRPLAIPSRRAACSWQPRAALASAGQGAHLSSASVFFMFFTITPLSVLALASAICGGHRRQASGARAVRSRRCACVLAKGAARPRQSSGKGAAA